MVTDAGEEDDGEEVVSFLTNQGVFKVDVLIITIHYDQDHVGAEQILWWSRWVARFSFLTMRGNSYRISGFFDILR